ncbi:predicted protein [Histoplasma capsulatum H143]|uniref:Uncharacterized protein n=1 Tax=Ajellomyces capsulatus (strain H143) TaxID=544712 RepID=C6HDF2_AJECH|nr:predicted protein [Histoplasma capsulatum H143]
MLAVKIHERNLRILKRNNVAQGQRNLAAKWLTALTQVVVGSECVRFTRPDSMPLPKRPISWITQSDVMVQSGMGMFFFFFYDQSDEGLLCYTDGKMAIALRPVTALLSVGKSKTRSFHSNVDVPRFAGKFPKMFIS